MTFSGGAERFHASGEAGDWRCLYHLASACFRVGSLSEGVALAGAIDRVVAGDERQFLQIDLRHDGVVVSLLRRDGELARRISAVAGGLGFGADPAAVQVVNVTLDALAGADVLPFWQAVLGYRRVGDDYLADPLRRGPGFGLQQSDVPRSGRGRMHLDVAVPHDQAEARVAAALAAGGRLVSDAHAPKWWVLADAEGNEACIATWVGR